MSMVRAIWVSWQIDFLILLLVIIIRSVSLLISTTIEGSVCTLLPLGLRIGFLFSSCANFRRRLSRLIW